jgi:phage tail-like protein|tara:strand:- start:5204 stop:5743 length:540 start_codon:yes stop_codon:yes gene_type:complete
MAKNKKKLPSLVKPVTKARPRKKLPKLAANDKYLGEEKIWPLPAFHFKVEFDNQKLSFQEVSGLGVQVETQKYRHGNSRQQGNYLIPSRPTFEAVTLKKGMFLGDTTLFSWFKKNMRGSISTKDITVTLLNEKNNSEMVWKLTSAHPSKITFPEFKSESSDIAIESLELEYEDLSFYKV